LAFQVQIGDQIRGLFQLYSKFRNCTHISSEIKQNSICY